MRKYSPFELIRKSIIYGYCAPLNISRDEKNDIWRQHYRRRLHKYLQVDLIKVAGLSTNESNTVFTSWLQGYDAAPQIVKNCLDSIQRFAGSRTIINITSENFKDYVEIPEFVIDKWQHGQISNAHFSDLIRVAVLDKYGGIWMDATVMLFASIPDYIAKSTLFFYQNSFLGSDYPGVSNWLIGSRYAGNPFIHALYGTLINYWRHNSKVEDYYLFHDFVILLSQQSELQKEWEKVPYFNNVNPHLLQHELNEKFDIARLVKITEMSPVQKLTYKFDQHQTNPPYTFLNYLVKKEL